MKNELNLKEIVALEKNRMLPLNFFVDYILVPLYAVISISLMVAFAVMMETDDEKYLVQGLICLVLFVVISAIFLASVPFIRKKAIKSELDRYDFDASKIEECEVWDYSTEEFSLKFDKNGMYVNDELFYYSHLRKTVLTSNRYKRVGIYLCFAGKLLVTMPVNPKTLKMLECLEIELDNEYVLDYIISNKKDAFEEIYKRGNIVT
ncbi:MAG: hypothetical protein IJ306_09750 [Oscillospiraceae bacterium]|nr:hypothetical protein [Oscillospiraceae bacterium]